MPSGNEHPFDYEERTALIERSERQRDREARFREYTPESQHNHQRREPTFEHGLVSEDHT